MQRVMEPVVSGILLLALAAAPGLLLSRILLPSSPPAERRLLGAISGGALLIISAYVATSLRAPLLTLPTLAVCALALGWYARGRSVAPAETGSLPVTLGLAALLLGAWCWNAAPVWIRLLPHGTDPGFHVSIIEIIRTQGQLPTTWGPYEPSERFNYPSALHCVMALYARLSGLPSERVFILSLLVCAALTLPAIYLLGRRCGGHPGAGALAVILYGFTDGWGTLASHADWGGLPNLASLLLMWGMLIASLAPAQGSLIIVTLCAVALAFLHHLSFAIVVFVAVFMTALEWLSEKRLSAPVRKTLLATCIAGATAGVAVIVKPAGHFGVAEAFRFDRETLLTAPRVLTVVGWPVLFLGSAALARVLWRGRDPQSRLFAGWTVALLAFWATWDIVYRELVFAFTHQNYTAFTPSRGLTDAAVLLAVLGGSFVWSQLAARPRKAAWVGALLVLAIAHGWRAEEKLFTDARDERSRHEPTLAFCEELQRRTPAEAVIYGPVMGDLSMWLPYITRRETNSFPDPGYATSPWRAAKLEARTAVEFADLLRRERHRPTYYMTQSTFQGGRLVLALNGWRLYEVPA
jgi:hypothetical protein